MKSYARLIQVLICAVVAFVLLITGAIAKDPITRALAIALALFAIYNAAHSFFEDRD